MFLELLFADQTNVDGDQSGFLVKHVKAHILSSTEVQTSVPPLNIIDGTDVEGEHAPCCRGPDGRIEPRVPHVLYEAAERLASGILRQVVGCRKGSATNLLMYVSVPVCFIYCCCRLYSYTFLHTACDQWKTQPFSSTSGMMDTKPFHIARSKSITTRFTRGSDGSSPITARRTSL